MKKHYVVRLTNGYYEAKNKKDAMEFFAGSENAEDVIYTRLQDGNYYHNRVKVIA